MNRLFLAPATALPLFALLTGVGCAKNGPAAEGEPAASSSAAVAASGRHPRAGAVATPILTEPGAKPDKAEWKSGGVVSLGGAIGLGCEGRQLRGWLRVLCRSKNGTGGKPTAITPGPDAKAEVSQDSGELSMVVPFVSGTKLSAEFRWTDTMYRLEAEWPTGKPMPPSPGAFKWGADPAVNKACAELGKSWRDRIEKLKTAGLSPASVARLPRNIGQCQPAGLGGWALQATDLAKVDCGGAECARLALEVVHVADDGKVATASAGDAIVFEPGKLRVMTPTLYDWDGDGHVDAFLRWEAEPPAGAAAPAEAKPSTGMWSFAGGKVAPYAGITGITVERTTHADNDARPDLLYMGPYAARLPKQCGLVSCPTRLAGPGFVAHATDGGKFALDDAVALDSAKKACPNPPADVVALAGENVDIGRTARNVACARVLGRSAEEVGKQLTAAKAKLCVSGKGPCSAFEALGRWAKATPPITVK